MRWATPVAPNPRAMMMVTSASWGTWATCFLKFSTLSRTSLMALLSACSHLSIFSCRPAPNNKIASHKLENTISTGNTAVKRLSLTLNTSFMAVWLAPPPIQLPAMVVSPRQTASGPWPPTTSGAKNDTSKMASGPPMMIPADPVRNMIRAFGPRCRMDFMSMLRVNRTRLAGSR